MIVEFKCIPNRMKWEEIIQSQGHGLSDGVIDSEDFKLDVALNLGYLTTVFQADVLAILEYCAAKEANSTNQSEIGIYMDSESSVKALSSPYADSILVKECKDWLDEDCPVIK